METSTMNRLAFIRYLFIMAVEQSYMQEPQAAASILTFHDSVELFLQLAAEFRNVKGKQIEFMGYWEELKRPPSKINLTQKESMYRLNRARAELKHQGSLPSRLTIESLRSATTNFFEENTPIVFEVDFDSISMINLVAFQETRTCLESASKLLQEGNPDEALVNIALAFQKLINHYTKNKEPGDYRKSPFFFGGEMHYSPRSTFLMVDVNFGTFLEQLKESVESMRVAIMVLSLGLDYRRFAKYSLIKFHIRIMKTGGERIRDARTG